MARRRKTIKVRFCQRVSCPLCDRGWIVWTDEGKTRYNVCERCKGMGEINVTKKEAQEMKWFK